MRMRDLPAAVPRDKVKSKSIILIFSASRAKVQFSVMCMSVYFQFFPLMLSSSSQWKAPGGLLLPPLIPSPLRGRSQRSVSFSCCKFAQCRRRFWNLKTLLRMELLTLYLFSAVCCSLQHLQNYLACLVNLDHNLVLACGWMHLLFLCLFAFHCHSTFFFCTCWLCPMFFSLHVLSNILICAHMLLFLMLPQAPVGATTITGPAEQVDSGMGGWRGMLKRGDEGASGDRATPQSPFPSSPQKGHAVNLLDVVRTQRSPLAPMVWPGIFLVWTCANHHAFMLKIIFLFYCHYYCDWNLLIYLQ